MSNPTATPTLIPQRTHTPSGMSTRYLSTTDAYNLWAPVYDSDGNFLQAMDSLEMKSLFPRMLSEITSPKPWKLVDLGCGTGRNTIALVGVEGSEVVAVDASKGMLEVARKRLEQMTGGEKRLRFETVDLIESASPPQVVLDADAVVSTLVIEHIPCDTFFSHASQMLKASGLLLLTNMHADMGNLSQAGFVDAQSGQKIRPVSYAHTVEEVLKSAEKYGLELLGSMIEKGVTEDLTAVLGERSKKYIGVTCWFGGLFRKKS